MAEEIKPGVEPDDEQARHERELAERAREAALKREGVIEGSAEEIPEFTPDPDAETLTGTDIDLYRRMELEDERAIMEELQGRALDVMIYSFQQDGKPATGFSWTGMAEGVNTLNRRGYTRIRISPEHVPQFEEVEIGGKPAIRCIVYAEDAQHGSGNWGVAEQPKKMKAKGSEIPDPFAYRKALSKAQRNAFEPLIPLELREYLKAQYLGQGKVKVIPGAEGSQPERPPALTDDRAQEQVARMRAVYDEIKAIDRLVMPPGQFNAILMGAQHDHERLDDAIAHLEAFRDAEEEIRSVGERLRQLVGNEGFEKITTKLVGMNQQKRKALLLKAIEDAEGGDS